MPAVATAPRSSGTPLARNVGATYKGFSLDGYYTKENGAVGAGSLSAAQLAADASRNDPPRLTGTITDNEAYSVMGKYTFDFGGGFKDEGHAPKLTSSPVMFIWT